MSTGLTEKICEFVSQTNYDQLPLESIDIVKASILDWLGVSITGTREPAFEIAVKYVNQINTINQASILCRAFKTTAEWAALVNGIPGHITQSDLSSPTKLGYALHPAAAIIPAAIAMGEKQNVSGKQLITACVVSLEVLYLIGAAIGKQNLSLGWHPTSIIGSIGATLGCAKIVGLGIVETQQALGISSSLACGLKRNFGTMTKALHVGNAARNGVLAADLANAGFTADDAILEKPFSFLSVFSGTKINDICSAELGSLWNTIVIGFAFKPFPCSRAAHASIEAILYLCNKFNITEDQVHEVSCKTSLETCEILKYHHPKTGEEAKFSLEYCLTMALYDRNVLPKHFIDETVTNSHTIEKMKKVIYSHVSDWPSGLNAPQEVTITLKNGRQYSHLIKIPKGEPDNPMTLEERLQKFKDYTRNLFNITQSERIIDKVDHLEYLDDISMLMKEISTEISR